MDDKLNIIISELKNLSGKVDNMENGLMNLDNRVQNMEISLKNLDGRVQNMENGLMNLDDRVQNVENEVKEFRGEVQTDLKVIKGGQTGIRNELTDRFNEIKTALRHLESDIEHTYLKTAQKLRKLKRQ